MLRFKRATAVVASAVLAAGLFAEPGAGATAPPGLPRLTGLASGGSPETVIAVLSAPCPPAAGQQCPAQAPVLAQLQAQGATVVSTTTLVDTITARVSPEEARALAVFPGVSQVIPDAVLPTPAPSALAAPSPARPVPLGAPGWRSHGNGPGSLLCGTERHPQLDPEALGAVHATQARQLGYDGAGVTVAFLADGLDPANPDFQRNPAFGRPGAPVISQYVDFSGDGTNAPTNGAEAFGDASSIAAQGNVAYDLSQYVNPAQAARLPSGGCWVRVVGDAPGANLMALKVFPQLDDETTSAFLQAIQYAVQNGAKVINESFGANNFPDTSLDVIREADDAAVAAGVTVVSSTGDAGSTSTIGSPASDPNVISVGATTTLRAYAQADFGGFDNPVVGNGRYVNGNISSLSSGGFTQAGNTVDLVAPGDLNWALCSTDTTMYSGCADIFGGTNNGLQLFGGTSEAAPLTAGAAADVIQAYAETHGGTDPSPALVKEILMSTATDLGAPATEQGAGLLDVAAAVKLAASLPVSLSVGQAERHVFPTQHSVPGRHAFFGQQPRLLVSPNQVNLAAAPGTAESQQISLTNPGDRPAFVHLSTRALSQKTYDSGTQAFYMNSASLTENSGTFQIWSGVTEVYQVESFQVPPAGAGSRLVFSADYQDTNQTSPLHFALFEPDGSYAAYSEPQGLGGYSQVEVANPPPGRWTALFFTELNGATPDATGTTGPVQWDASVWRYAPSGSVTPSSLAIAPGQTATATLDVTTPASPGDTSLSVVVSSGLGQATTVPVTVRSTVALGALGGTFSGVLTGGNGRAGAPAQTNTYFFQVPPGEADMEASVALANDPGEELIAYLVDPGGQTVGYTSNYTLGPSSSGLVPTASPYAEIYHVAPEAGTWELVLGWQNPVTGNELDEPFTGAISFDQVRVKSNLPDSPSDVVARLTSTAFDVTVDNTGVAPEALFVDPRLTSTATVALPNLNPAITATSFTLPLPATSPAGGLSFPYYLVPTHTSQLVANVARLSGPAPVTFDMSYFPGDPDVSPAQPAPGVSGTSASAGSGANLTLTGQPELSPGLWLINPDEVGPYPATGAPSDVASASLSAVTQAFDPTVTSSTDDFWQVGFAFSNFLYLLPGQSGTIAVDITPTAPSGTVASGTLYVDDFVLASLFSTPLPDSNELAAIPYSYTVGSTNAGKG